MNNDTTALVRQMRDALVEAWPIIPRGYRLDRVKTAIAAADRWLTEQCGPLTDEDITVAAFTKHGYAQGTPGSAMFRKGVRFAERAHGIGRTAEEGQPD